MSKIAFVGFGEVNTPIDIIVNKCKAAEEALVKEGLDLVSVYPITDDYEEKDIKKALDALEADHDYLTAGGVFPEELIKNFIKTKRAECSEMSKIPHPAEFDKYFNL